MRPICTVVDGLPSEGTTSLFPGPFSVFEMSMLRALDPVQAWLGQELEKCGIDAMIYTRYVLSLLLHDSYDYDLQEQENDIFLGWEKGACKKWGKGKKKSSDLSVEEMKKQAAVQCLLSASDETSGIETLVEELCSKLKDLQSSQGEQLPLNKEEKNKKLEVPLTPEPTCLPKDQAEMYYEAFPLLSEKPVCLQEIMTVWNKSKICSYSSSSSSSTAPQTSTETPSPKDCHSENETAIVSRNNGASNTVQQRSQQRKSKNEKENKANNGATEGKNTKSVRHKSNGNIRPRSWSSGSSEAGSSSSSNHGGMKTRFIKLRHKVREVRNKKGKIGHRNPSKNMEKTESKNTEGSSAGPVKPLCKRVKRQVKEYAWKVTENEGSDIYPEKKNEKEFREEPLWYTEPITEYFVPLNSKSKLETTYRKIQHNLYDPSEDIEELSKFVHGLHLSNHNIRETYLTAGTFIEGHFVEMPAVVDDEIIDPSGTSNCSLFEDIYLDDIHPVELSHFYEVEIDQSMLDPGASEDIQGESRFLSMIRQKSKVKSDFEAEPRVLDEKSLQGESAIWTESTSSIGADVLFLQDHSNLAQFWESCSPSSSVDADGESLGGDSPNAFSPFLDSTMLSTPTHAGNQDLFFDINNSYFSVFEVQCSNSVFSLPREVLEEKVRAESYSSTNGFGKTQSRLLIWTKNSAFDENEECSNISTRTCSPWSHSEETKSDNETLTSTLEEPNHSVAYDPNNDVPEVTLNLQSDVSCIKARCCFPQSKDVSALVHNKKSKLESVCGIQLEQDSCVLADVSDAGSPSCHCKPEYSSGLIKDIWASMADNNSETESPLFTVNVNVYSCQDTNARDDSFQEPSKVVQRSEYHLWEGQKENLETRAFLMCDSEVDGGDYTTPSKPWDLTHVKENSFIHGGVYGEFKAFSGEDEWAAIPTSPMKEDLEYSTSDVVTIAGTDVFMTPGNSFAPGHRPLWKPFISYEESEQLNKSEKGLHKGFSLILHENLLGSCGNLQGEEPGIGCSFSSFELNNRFSQVLHVECSFEPGGITACSPDFKPKAFCLDSDGETGHHRVCGIDQTQYRSIRISPRTHFRPISASELSPGGGSDSDFESEKEESVVPAFSEEVFDDPQDDLKPLEEDAKNEGHFYGKSELESGKFLPSLKKSGMEKSAQTSLDGQEESQAVLQPDKQECLDFRIVESQESEVLESSKINCKKLELVGQEDGGSGCRIVCETVSEELGEYPPSSVDLQGVNAVKEKPCWWQKALYSPLISGSCCDSYYKTVKEENIVENTNKNESSTAGWQLQEREKV
ncbi:hypothetical protein GDO86_000194 [Hymenochirus boettgeri]|nr:hypothetical protein GDO86_000194 [Hymenochirus boettgeri]